ncbi:BON domain-containing protein [Coxiella-like endosymbiont]|uniref:BON domain-containing protein n=1 Tax=Coxiella-like endosymbiont TaxID=1592897 RepID=UPI00272B0AAB|nr:BON domain-containing protein [Coxiella-like endosymbiont]
MLGKSGLHSSNLKVVAENKVVYLMGMVSPKQAAMAADVARRISGVEKVVKVFEYE